MVVYSNEAILGLIIVVKTRQDIFTNGIKPFNPYITHFSRIIDLIDLIDCVGHLVVWNLIQVSIRQS